MTDKQATMNAAMMDAIIGGVVAVAIAIGAYYANQIDSRDAEQDKRINEHQIKSEQADREHETLLAEHAHRITSNEKEIEFATRKFVAIDSKLDELLKEVRQLREAR